MKVGRIQWRLLSISYATGHYYANLRRRPNFVLGDFFWRGVTLLNHSVQGLQGL